MIGWILDGTHWNPINYHIHFCGINRPRYNRWLRTTEGHETLHFVHSYSNTKIFCKFPPAVRITGVTASDPERILQNRRQYFTAAPMKLAERQGTAKGREPSSRSFRLLPGTVGISIAKSALF